ncbi:hypothetical protein GCK32_012445, partial [Trichostrongylus colubriformis]
MLNRVASSEEAAAKLGQLQEPQLGKKKAGKIYHKDELRKRRGSYSYEGYTSLSHDRADRRSQSLYPERVSSEMASRELTTAPYATEEYAEGNLLICNFLVVVFAVDCILVYILLYTSFKEGVGLIQNTTLSYETTRSVMQILSDNLDCSLLMKEAGLNFKSVQHQMWIGLQCLKFLYLVSKNPKSVHAIPISTLFYYEQGPKMLAHNYQMGKFTKDCSRGEPSLRCGLGTQYKMMRSYVGEHETFNNSPLYSIWMSQEFKSEDVKKWLFTWEGKKPRKNTLRQFKLPEWCSRSMHFYTNYETSHTFKHGSKIKLDEKSWEVPPTENKNFEI